MTPQEIFDTVATHLFTQGRRAECAGSCFYRAPDGSKCAVGCLIPDRLYSDEMEGVSARSMVRCFKVPSWMRDNIELLVHLQNAHDNDGFAWAGERELRGQLAKVALSFDLDASALASLHFPEQEQAS